MGKPIVDPHWPTTEGLVPIWGVRAAAALAAGGAAATSGAPRRYSSAAATVAPEPDAVLSAVSRTKRVSTGVTLMCLTAIVFDQVPVATVVNVIPSRLTLTLYWPITSTGDGVCRGS